MKNNPELPRKPDAPRRQPWSNSVEERVAALRFGTVQIVVHEGRVTQVDSTERTRFTPSEAAAA
ncbi:MAG: YezD family protein [Chthoniobacteraceae bacterium]